MPFYVIPVWRPRVRESYLLAVSKEKHLQSPEQIYGRSKLCIQRYKQFSHKWLADNNSLHIRLREVGLLGSPCELGRFHHSDTQKCKLFRTIALAVWWNLCWPCAYTMAKGKKWMKHCPHTLPHNERVSGYVHWLLAQWSSSFDLNVTAKLS